MRRLIWVGPAREELIALPNEVQDVFGYALYLAQTGDKHPSAKPLKGFPGAKVLEVVEDFDGDTFRAVYTVRFSTGVYALHVFQKKSRRGIATPKQELELIRRRLGWAEQIHRQLVDQPAANAVPPQPRKKGRP